MRERDTNVAHVYGSSGEGRALCGAIDIGVIDTGVIDIGVTRKTKETPLSIRAAIRLLGHRAICAQCSLFARIDSSPRPVSVSTTRDSEIPSSHNGGSVELKGDVRGLVALRQWRAFHALSSHDL